MINRELIKENNSVINKEKVFPFAKVEQLLTVNEKLRTLVEKSKDRNQASNLASETFQKSFRDYSLNHSFVTNTTTNKGPVSDSREVTIRGEIPDQVELLKAEVSNLHQENSKLKVAAETNKLFNFQINSLQKQLNDSENRNKQLEAEVNSVKAENIQLKRDLNEYANSDYKRENIWLKSELARKDGELSRCEDVINHFQRIAVAMEDWQREKEIYERAIEERSQEILTLKKRIDILEPLHRENQLIKQRYFLLRTATEFLRNKIDDQNVTMNKMQQLINADELLDVEVDIRKLVAQRDVLAAQNERMKKPIKEKILNLDQLKLRLSTELQDFEQLKKSFRQLDDPSSTTSRQDFNKTREGLTKTLELRKSAMMGFHVALEDVDMLRGEMVDMRKELKEVKSEANSEQVVTVSHSVIDEPKSSHKDFN